MVLKIIPLKNKRTYRLLQKKHGAYIEKPGRTCNIAEVRPQGRTTVVFVMKFSNELKVDL